MQEHAHSLAGAPPPAVRTLSCPPTGTVTLAIDDAAPLIESVEAHLHAEDALRARLRGSTLRVELGARVPDPVALRSLGRVLREVHGCTLIAVDCDEEALRRFAEQQLHLVVHLAEPRIGESPAVVPPPLPTSVVTVEPAPAAAAPPSGAAAGAEAPSEDVDLADFDDSDDDPNEDWADEHGDAPDAPAASDALPDESATTAPDPAEDTDLISVPEPDSSAAELPADAPAGPPADASDAPPGREAEAAEGPAAANAEPAAEPAAELSEDPTAAADAEPAAEPSEDPTETDAQQATPEPCPPASPELCEPESRALPQGWNPEGRGQVTAVRRTLRSGNRVRAAGDLVVYGDVNAGAQVEATGNVIVLGALRGLAHAGVNGETEAVVLALELDRGQVRIADQISFEADAPSADPSRRGRLRLLLGRGPSAAAPRSGPTLVRLDGDHIVTEAWRGRLPDLSAR